MALSLKEAAHRLRMTVKLLLWSKSYSPKRDQRKLAINRDGTIDEAEVQAFDAYLRATWTDKNPGSEIQREIDRESRGLCGLCLKHSDTTEAAHINRKDIELDHYCQHPHNLINLCADCHTRYDRLRTLTNDQIRHAKEQLVARLMEDVDRDLEMHWSIRAYVAEHGPKLLSASVASLGFTQGLTQHAESVVTGSVTRSPMTPTEVDTKLSFLSGSIEVQSPITSKLLSTYATSLKQGEPPTEVKLEELFDDPLPRPGKCYRDGADTAMESASCTECGEDAGHHEITVPRGDGTYELFDEEVRGDTAQVECECGSTAFDVEFEALCSYCAHMADKD